MWKQDSMLKHFPKSSVSVYNITSVLLQGLLCQRGSSLMLENLPTKSAVGSYSGVLTLDCVKNPRNGVWSTDSIKTACDWI